MARKRSADMLTIACKLPQGLSIPMPDGPNLVLNGAHSPFALMGHGMTDVKAAAWAIVEDQHAESAWLKNEVVFAMGDKESAVDKAEDRVDTKAGFEPVDPKAFAAKGITKAD
jgi:hypothetical protein